MADGIAYGIAYGIAEGIAGGGYMAALPDLLPGGAGAPAAVSVARRCPRTRRPSGRADVLSSDAPAAAAGTTRRTGRAADAPVRGDPYISRVRGALPGALTSHVQIVHPVQAEP